MPLLIAALLRHGDYQQPARVPSAHLPYPLTERGREQALTAARKLVASCEERGWRLDEFIETSPLQRAYETARIIADAAGEADGRAYQVVQHRELAERCVGSAANLAVEQIESILDQDPRYEAPPEGWKSSAHYKLPFAGAESLLEAGRRVAGRLEDSMHDLALIAAADTVRLFVGHGGSFRFAAVHVGLLDADEAPLLTMEHCGRVDLSFDRGARWEKVGGDWKVRAGGPFAAGNSSSGRER